MQRTRSLNCVTLFDTEITLTGPYRRPAQMLAAQAYGGHTSVHDAETAGDLGFAGAPIEAPTHFSQFDPLAVARRGAGVVRARLHQRALPRRWSSKARRSQASLTVGGARSGADHGAQG